MKKTIDAIYNDLEARLKNIRPLCKNGSCGFVALCIAKFLKKEGIDCELRSFQFGKYKRIHVMAKVPLGYIDKRGFSNATFYKLMQYEEVSHTIDELQKLVDDEKLWNKNFNVSFKQGIEKIMLAD